MTPQQPRTVDLFVNGRWQPPQAGQYEPSASPVTGELIGQVAQGDRADAGAAVQAAAAALGGWASATAFERARALHRVAGACQQRRTSWPGRSPSTRASRCWPRPTRKSMT